MKYLKLFENLEDMTIDQDYIESCFVDFIDEDNFKLKFYAGRKTCEITFDVKDSSYVHLSNSIQEFNRRSQVRNRFFNRIEECLSKVKIEYPNMKHKVMDMSGADQQEIIVILTISKDYMSHNPSGWYSL